MKNDALLQIQVFYEIAMAIGGSLDLKKMLKTSLMVYLKKLSCTSGIIYRIIPDDTQTVWRIVPQCAIPRNAIKNQAVKEALKDLPEVLDKQQVNLFLSTLPILGQSETGQRFHVMELSGFGFFILIKSGNGIDQSTIQSLRHINRKLADSSIACLQKETIEHINQQLSIEIEVRKEAEKAKTQFLSNMSHEILTPMNGITWLNKLLLESKLTDEQQELLNYLDTSVESLLKVLTALFDFSGIEAGKTELEEIDFNVQTLLDDIISFMSSKARAKKIELHLEIHPETPVNVKGDPRKIHQILTYIIDNAIKFTHKGQVVVRICPKHETGNTIELEFSVTDTGIGIPEEKMDVLFEKFSQADESDTRKYGGTGLGLSIAKRFCELMGGQISASNNLDAGSQFKVALTLRKSDISIPLENQELTNRQKPVHALIVDDNPINRKVVEVLCKKLNWQADNANDGKQAITLLEKKEYDLVLMDCQMPEMDGYEATKIIRDSNSNVKNHDITIIAVTANVSEENHKKCLKVGMDGFIPKPIKLLPLLKISQNLPQVNK